MAAIAGLVVVGVLALLIMESSAVDEAYYASHAETMRSIDTARSDVITVYEGASAAFQEGRFTPVTMSTALSRLDDTLLALQSPADPADVETVSSPEIDALASALVDFRTEVERYTARQNALAQALRRLQEESPEVVKELRRFDLRLQSQNAFTLAIDVIEFATGQSAADAESLQTRIETLRSDREIDSRAPGLLDDFASAAETVLTEHDNARAALENLSVDEMDGVLATLSATLQSANQRTVNRAERSRILLAICALVLLGGTGYAMWRLQTSYQELNESNAELEKSNDSLEERVASRTEELKAAYDEISESQVQLVQAEKMSSLGELVAGISHEINTPLYYLSNNTTVVQDRMEAVSEFCTIAETMIAAVQSKQSVKDAVFKGLTDMQKMFRDGLREDVDEAKDLMQDSLDGLDDLMELAQSLKDFSRLDRAKHGQLNVNDGLEKTLLITKNKLKYNVTVHKHFGEVPKINCSPSQINQVFLNLITNAADAITESGEIVIHTWSEDDKVCVSIADTGCGIPEEILAKVRDPFFTTKEVGKGTGLGLSIVDRIVSAHNGELRIESERDKGTIITVVLPIGELGTGTDAENDSDIDVSDIDDLSVGTG
ncbi:MAG: GHKL domain-containing protein [Gammaproteobacteria bacterium]|nr:GHKL domain-containing protein [Gammaproteobacteria bacterium]